MRNHKLVQRSYDRPRLKFTVMEKVDAASGLDDLVRFIRKRRNKTGIVYSLTRKDAEQLAGASERPSKRRQLQLSFA